MKKLLLVLTLLSSSLYAKLDYSSQGLLRSYPIGLFLNGNVGYSFKIWDQSQKALPLYGYIRPNMFLQTSAVVNSARAQVDVAPIAPLVFYGGARYVNRDFKNLDTFDCDVVQCRDQMLRRYWGFKFAAKVGKFFVMNDNRYEIVEMQDNTEKVFAEEMGSLLGNSGKDVLRQSTLILGYEINETWNAGVLGLFSSMKNIANSSRKQMGFAQYKSKNKWNIIGATGVFHDRLGSDVWSTLVLWSWNGKMGNRLF